VIFVNSTSTQLIFAEPFPNVQQVITLGTLDQTFPGWVNVNNSSAIPAPYVQFVSADGEQGNPGNLYITNQAGASANGLVFNSTNGGVINTIELNNSRLYVGKNNPGGFDGGGFQNTTGYTTVNGGFVMMSGNAAQVVNGAASASANVRFGNFGVDNNSGVSP